MPAATIERDESHGGFIDLLKHELRNARVQNLGTAPSSPVEGQIYYDTVGHVLYYYNGTSWVSAAGGSYTDEQARDAIGAALVAGNNIDITVNDAGDTITIDVEALTSADLSDFTTAARAAISVTDTSELDLSYAGGAISGSLIAGSVALTRLANIAAGTIVGNNTGGAGAPLALTAAQTKTLLAIVPGDVTGFDTQVRTNRLDQMAAPTASVAMGSQKITGLADPTSAQEAATKAYVDATAAGIDWKRSVRAATTAPLTLATAFENGDAIDGVTLATGDRILIKDQAAGAENGIYTVNASGAPTRATDADTAAEVTGGMAVFVEEGTTNADTGWVMTNNGAITLGTTALVFAQFTALGQITAGAALTKTGSTLDVAVDTTTIEVSSDALRIAATAAGNGLTGGGGSALAVNPDGTTIEISGDAVRIAATAAGNGLTGGGGSALAVNTGTGLEISSDAVRIAAAAAGAGLTGGAGSALAVGAGTGMVVNADDVAVDTAVVVRKAVGALTGGANSEVITHSLGTRDVQVALRNNASPYDVVEVYNEATTTNTVTVYAASGNNLPAGYRWIVHG